MVISAGMLQVVVGVLGGSLETLMQRCWEFLPCCSLDMDLSGCQLQFYPHFPDTSGPSTLSQGPSWLESKTTPVGPSEAWSISDPGERVT